VSSPLFHLRTLGSFQLDGPGPEGLPVRLLAPGKPLALLTYLALAPDRRASRDFLQELLWGGSTPELGRHTLRQTLFGLRQRLGDGMVRSDGDNVVLDHTLRSDVADFEAALAASEPARAIQLYGGPFIPAFAAPGSAGFEQWADLVRERLRREWSVAAAAVARKHLDSGNPRAAEHLARRLVEDAPLAEPFGRLLLECLLAAGDRMRALLEAEALEARLREEGQAPARETARLIERVRQGPAASEVPVQAAQLRTELIGREQPFAAILRAWEQARAGAGRALQLRGAAGLGKTRLVEDIESRLQSTGQAVVRLRARSADRDVPWALAATIAERLAGLPGARGIAPASAAELVDLAPTVSLVFPAAPPARRAREELPRVRALALEDLLAAVSSEAPVVLLVDDLHWADSESRRVLSALTERVAAWPVLVVLATRPIRGELGLSGAAVIQLDPLDEEQVEAMVAAIASADAELLKVIGQAVFRASSGVPLLALTAIEYALEQGLLSIADGRWRCPDPATVRDALSRGGVLERRLEDLPPRALQLVRLLALAGRPLSPGVLASAGGPEGGALEELLFGLEQRGLVLRSDVGWELSHDRIQETVLAGLSADARANLARRIGRLLLGLAEPTVRELQDAGRLLGMAGDPAQAMAFHRWLRAIGDPASWRDPLRSAVRFLGSEAQLDAVRGLASTLPRLERLARGWPRRFLGVAAVLLAVALVTGARQVARWTGSPAASMVVRLPALTSVGQRSGASRLEWSDSLDGFLFYGGGDTAASTVVEVDFLDARGQVTANAPDSVTVRPVGDGVRLLRGGTARVADGRARLDSLTLSGPGMVRLEARADGLPVIRTNRLVVGSAYGTPLRPIHLLGGTINGQQVGPGRNVVEVRPGEVLEGTVRFQILTTSYTARIEFGVTPTWGDRTSSFFMLEDLPSHGEFATTVALEDARDRTRRFRAPERPGTWRLVFVLGAETATKYLMSRSNWLLGDPVWFDGDDVVDLPDSVFDRLDRDGVVPDLPWLGVTPLEDGPPRPLRQRAPLGGQTIRVVVR
jgi:DNA-binding SARP family transcriptional activator